jgi:hypothetical protein
MKLYHEHRNSMKTGDVIAFSGRGRISKIIKWKTKSPYSHVGVVMDTQIQGGIGKAVLMMESTALCPHADDLSGEFVNGVQLHFLSKRLEHYDGQAWWLPLRELLPHYAAFNMQMWLREERVKRVPYDAIGAIGAGADLLDWIPGVQNDPDFSSLFCSELVTKALQIAGVVNDNINPSEQTPADVSLFPCFGNVIKIK